MARGALWLCAALLQIASDTRYLDILASKTENFLGLDLTFVQYLRSLAFER